MTRILEIQELLQDTSAAIALAERAVVNSPNSYGLLLNQQSLRKRFDQLEEQFKDASARLAIDACRYRMFRNDDTPNALASTTAIAYFQQLVSLVYDAMTGTTKRRARVSAETLKETSFGIGYVFPGSVGFVLTLPAERTLFDDGTSPLDKVIETIFGVALTRSPEHVSILSKTLGPSVVRSIYKWASVHTDYWMGMDIEWMRGRDSKLKLFLQQKELKELRDVIAETSEKIDEDYVVEGEYVGADVDRNTVHIQVPEAGDIFASFGEQFTADQLPPEFWTAVRAHFIKRTKIHLSMDREEVKYLVTKIEPLA